MPSNKKQLQAQFKKLIQSPTIPSRLTKALYDTLHIESGFIAHFDRAGFHSARFYTLRDFDHTLLLIRRNKKLAYLLEDIDADLLGQARYKVACIEASALHQQAKVIEHHILTLQAKFTKPII